MKINDNLYHWKLMTQVKSLAKRIIIFTTFNVPFPLTRGRKGNKKQGVPASPINKKNNI